MRQGSNRASRENFFSGVLLSQQRRRTPHAVRGGRSRIDASLTRTKNSDSAKRLISSALFARSIFSPLKFFRRGDRCTRARVTPREDVLERDRGPFALDASLSGVAVFFVVL